MLESSIWLPIQFLFLLRALDAKTLFRGLAYAALSGFSAEFGMNHVPGCDLTGLDFAKLAEGHGVEGRLVDSVDALDAALGWSFAAPHPTLLDIRIA